MLPLGAALDATTAALAVGINANLWLVQGGTQFSAVLTRNAEFAGEFGNIVERRDKLTFNLASAPALQSGMTLTADAARYSAAEFAALPRTSWKLDAVESDDGHVATWWAR